MANFRKPYRFLARIVIETTAPMQIGSGNKSIKTDSLILRDINGLPYIPGTTLAGLIRHELPDIKERDKLMGTQREGSPLIITEAHMLDNLGCVLDGVIDIDNQSECVKKFLEHYMQLPIRQHVRINHRGTAADTGKFDEEVILKGTRFCFEMEMLGSNENEISEFKKLSDIIKSPTFRIGGGSRSGFGAVKVVECKTQTLDLNKEEDLKLYLCKSSSLAEDWQGWNAADNSIEKTALSADWTKYVLKITPEDFLLFGSGFSGEDTGADMAYVKETHVKWTKDEAEVKERNKQIVIPASSVKGALAHRTAFHYNKLTGVMIKSDGSLTNGKNVDDVTGKHNDAVKCIFGSEGEKDETTKKMKDKLRGNILISDVIKEKDNLTSKVLNHVKIDRFTGGAIDGALFNEEVLYAPGEQIDIEILINNKAFEKENVQSAFEHALKDVADGLLPLGGGVNRGNGCFTGKVVKNYYENGSWKEIELV